MKNPVAKNLKINRPATHIDKKREAKKEGPERVTLNGWLYLIGEDSIECFGGPDLSKLPFGDND